MMIKHQDTIAAVSTLLGEAAIGIIRISGPESKKIVESIFVTNKPKIEHRKQITGWIIDSKNNKKIDNVILVYLEKPNTYTGEDMVEIFCHGGVAVLNCILEEIISLGARIADHGEFSKRAFLNGKIDMVQAEAVIDLIKAKTRKAIYAAAERLNGSISSSINSISERLKNGLSEIEASIDFPEDIDEPKTENLKGMIGGCISEIDSILSNSENGRILNDGVTAAIVGKPNVGKSSILNAILKKNRAIVTEIPGTTTDTIEETVAIKGYPFILIDTAGIRDAGNAIEIEGIERTRIAVERADVIIAVYDAEGGRDRFDDELDDLIMNKSRIISIMNKCDKGSHQNIDQICDRKYVNTSAIYGQGIKELEDKLVDIAISNKDVDEMKLLSNVRQIQDLKHAQVSLLRTMSGLNENVPVDILSIDLRSGINSLNSIIGYNLEDDVIDRIFSRFCVGK